MNRTSSKWTAPTAAELYELPARIAKALGHPTRLRILRLIAGIAHLGRSCSPPPLR